MWLDGSFLSIKPEPSDIDFLLVTPSAEFDSGTPKMQGIVDSLIEGNLWEVPFHCDTNVVFVDPPELGGTAGTLAYWRDDRFGVTMVDRKPKGIVTISLKGRSL